jgi:rubrerythrin
MEISNVLVPALPEMLDQFMACAIRLEGDSAHHYEELAFDARSHGFDDIGDLFAELGQYSFMHLAETQRKADAMHVEDPAPEAYLLAMAPMPERNPLTSASEAGTRLDILKSALISEKRGCDFYAAVADLSHNVEVKSLAREFAEEESIHVTMLEDWIARETMH